MWPCIVTNLFVIKPTRCTNFTNLFCRETLHVSDSSSVHHQEFIHRTLSNGWNVVPSWSCSKAVYKPVWHIPLLSVRWINSWWWTDELSETCRVSRQNKFVKLVHLVGFITNKLSATFIWTEGKCAISQTQEPFAGRDSTQDLASTKHECNHASSTFVSFTKVGPFQWPSSPTPGSFANSTDSVLSGIMHGTTPPLVNMTSRDVLQSQMKTFSHYNSSD